MHEPLLGRAANPPPAIVLGLPLRRYSLGHELLLHRDRNPLAERQTCTPQELAQAVWICAGSWEENSRPDFLLPLKMWVWGRRLRRMPFTPNLDAFIAYRSEGSLEFPLSDVVRPNSGPSPRNPGVPFILRVQQFIQLRFELSEPEAWDYPYGLAKMRWCAYWEQEGGLDVYNHLDAEHDQFVAEQEAKATEKNLCPVS